MKQKHFVLVLGICHGAWCWYRVSALLKSATHRVTPLDLGASGINPNQAKQMISYDDYAEPLTDFMNSLPNDEKVILVGHSFGGVSISFAMEKFPRKILAAVYVTAFMPIHGSAPATRLQEFFKSVLEETLMNFQLSYENRNEKPPTSAYFGPNHMVAKDIELAKTLLRPGKWFIPDLSKETLLTKENFGSVNRVYVLCNEDKLIKEGLQKWYIENNPSKDVKGIVRADHMAMFSRPKKLFQVLWRKL